MGKGSVSLTGVAGAITGMVRISVKYHADVFGVKARPEINNKHKNIVVRISQLNRKIALLIAAYVLF